jgi:DNA primase
MYHEQLLSPEGIGQFDYLTEDRGLSREAIEHFRLGAVLDPDDADWKMADRISIPYVTPTGIVQIKFRTPPWSDSNAKYLYSTGNQTTLFNTRAFLDTTRWIAVTEGELDCVAAWMAGVPAVGVPGVKNWKPHFRTLFEGYECIHVLADNDPSKTDDNGNEVGLQGLRFAEHLEEILPNVHIQLMPDEGDDVNSFVAREGPQALRDLLKL